MKILRAEKFQSKRRATESAPPQLRRTDWDVLMQHDRLTGKLDLKSKQFISDPASVKRLLENEMIFPDGRLTPEAIQKCGELARKLQKPGADASSQPVRPKAEASQRKAAKLTASDWAVLMKYDRRTGNLLKYDNESGQLDTTSRAILKDPAIIQRLIDNNKILPGGWLTPEAKKECARIEAKLKAQPADDYSGPESPPDPNGELLSKGERSSEGHPAPEAKSVSDTLSKAYASRQHYPEPKVGPTDQTPQDITQVDDLTGHDMQTFFENISYEDAEPESKRENISYDEPNPNPEPERQPRIYPEQPSKKEKTRTPESMQTQKVPIQDSASSETMRNVDWGAIARLSHQKKERPRRRGRGPDSTDGDIPEPPAISMRDIFHVVFKRRTQIVLFFAAVFLTVAIGTFLTKPTYEASAQILVKLGRESVFMPATGDSRPIINLDREERINSEIEILSSQALAEKVVGQIGPTALYPDLKNDSPGLLDRLFPASDADISADQKRALRFESAVAGFMGSLEIGAIKKSNVIEIYFTHTNPQMAALVVNKLADTYLEHHVSVHKAPKSVKFFENQSQLLRTRMEQSEVALKLLKKQHNVTSLEEERSLLLQQSSGLRAELNATLSQKVEAEKRIGQISRQLAVTPKTIHQGEETDRNTLLINSLEARLVELQLEEKKLLARYTDHSRPVTNVREEIQMVSQKLTEQEGKRYGRKSTGLNPTYQNLQQTLYQNEAELNAIKAKAQTQQVHLTAYHGQLEQLNQVETELNQLQQQVDVNRENYRLYMTKFEESRISDAMDSEKITNVSLMQSASAPRNPVSPKKMLNLILAIFLGAFGGLGLAFFMEYMDDKIEKIEDVEETLDLPVLASVPIMDGKKTEDLTQSSQRSQRNKPTNDKQKKFKVKDKKFKL